MKNFKFLVIFLFGIATMQPIRTSESLHLNTNKTLLAYIYSYVWQQQQSHEIMPKPANNKVIIFDLDGVLLTANKIKAFQEIGIATTLQYICTQWKLPCHSDIFNALATAPAHSTFKAYNEGLCMPAIMVDWQCATQSLIAVQLEMKRHIKNSTKTESEKNFLLNIVSMMTTPEKFISTRQIIPAGVALLHELKEKGYKVYVLSNWDASSFPLLMASFPEIFTYQNKAMFDGIIISGQVGMLKPDPILFEKCLTDFNIQASDAIFIDDTIENIQTAQNIGIATIYCNPNNVTDTRTQLIKLLKKYNK